MPMSVLILIAIKRRHLRAVCLQLILKNALRLFYRVVLVGLYGFDWGQRDMKFGRPQGREALLCCSGVFLLAHRYLNANTGDLLVLS